MGTFRLLKRDPIRSGCPGAPSSPRVSELPLALAGAQTRRKVNGHRPVMRGGGQWVCES